MTTTRRGTDTKSNLAPFEIQDLPDLEEGFTGTITISNEQTKIRLEYELKNQILQSITCSSIEEKENV